MTHVRLVGRLLGQLTATGLAACVAAGCSRTAEAPSAAAAGDAGSAHAPRGAADGLPARIAAARAASVSATGTADAASIASLPDRGELAMAMQGAPSHRDGVDWHPVRLSEAHALASIASGTMKLRTPDGQSLTLRYAQREEHPSGDWTWIGTVDGPGGGQAILTFGQSAVFGRIVRAASDTPLAIATRAGRTYMGTTTREAIAAQRSRMRQDDAVVPASRPAAVAGTEAMRAEGVGGKRAASPDAVLPVVDAMRPPSPAIAAEAKAAAAAASIYTLPTIDFLIGYTQGVVTELGNRSAVVTRMNFHVDFLNLILKNSQVRGRVRLVHTEQVNYSDAVDMYQALRDLTGRDSPVPASLKPLHARRDKYGADLVMLVRRGGCGGVAHLLGAYGQPIDASWEGLGFSTVHEPGCADGLVIPHELGHNFGSAHDLASENGSRNGAYPYALGYRTLEPDGLGVADVMAYVTTHTKYDYYSNPYIKVRGVPLGSWNDGNDARTFNNTFPLIAAFRPTKVYNGLRARNDVSGDGKSDLMFHNFSAGQFSFWRMSGSTIAEMPPGRSAPAGGKVVASGDFNGDRKTDLVWMTPDRKLWLWRSTGQGWSAYPLDTAGLTAATQIVGAADLDGDRKDELLLVGGGRFSYWKLSFVTPLRGTTYTLPAGAQLVATGDLNADGRQDLVWMSASRQLYLWWSNGGGLDSLNYASASIGQRLSSGYRLVGASDINGDGKSDLLFHDQGAGVFAYWVMNRNLVASQGGRSLGTSAAFAATGDFNGDGNGDMLWRRGSELIMWFGNGTEFPWQYRSLSVSLPGVWHVSNGGVGGV